MLNYIYSNSKASYFLLQEHPSHCPRVLKINRRLPHDDSQLNATVIVWIVLKWVRKRERSRGTKWTNCLLDETHHGKFCRLGCTPSGLEVLSSIHMVLPSPWVPHRSFFSFPLCKSELFCPTWPHVLFVVSFVGGGEEFRQSASLS